MADYTVRFLGDDKQLSGTLKNIKGELNSTGQASSKLDQIQQRFNKIINSSAPLKKQLRDLTALMAKMNLDNMVDNDVFVAMTAKAAEMKDALGDASQAIRLMSSDTAGLDATIEGFQVLAGAAGVATGVMGALGAENENLQQAMLKVQSVISVMNGVQQIANAINKDSILMLKLKQLWQTANNAATVKSTAETVKNTAATTANTVAGVANNTATKIGTVAQNAWNVAKAVAKAMVGDFTGLLLVGAGALLTYSLATSDSTEETDKQAEATKRAKEASDEFAKSVADGCSKQIAQIETLTTQYSNLHTEIERNDFINKHRREIENLVGATDDLKGSWEKFVRYKDKIVAALTEIAIANAYQAQIEKVVSEYIEKRYKLTSGTVKYKEWKQGDVVSEDKVKELGLVEGVDYKKGGMNWQFEKLNLLEAPGVEKANTYEYNKSRKGRQDSVNALDKGVNARVSGLVNEMQKHRNNANSIYSTIPLNNNTTTTGGGRTNRTHSGKYTGGGNDNDTRSEYQKYIDEINAKIKEAQDKLNIAIVNNEKQSIIKPLEENLKELIEAKQKIDDAIKAENEKINSEIAAEKADEEGAIKAGVSLKQYKLQKPYFDKDFIKNADLKGFTIGKDIKLDIDLEATKRASQALAKQFTKSIPTDQLYKFTEEYQSAVEQLKGTEWGESLFNMLEGDTTADKVSGIGQSFQALGNVLANFDGAAAKAGAVLAAVGQIVLGFAQASVMASKLGPIGWIAWLGAGLAAVATTIATIKGFADGGIIEGSSYHGDRIVARLNAGEMVLNRKQQANLFRALDNGISSNAGGGKVEFEIKGSTLKGVLKNYDNKMNKVR